MGYTASLIILATQAFVTILPNPVAVPAPFPGGVGPDGTRYKTAYKCEGESLEISCASDQTIKIIRANFGRFSIAICNRQGTTDMSVNCMSPASNRVMKKKCDGFNSCAINISSSEFGDPCPATPKYLEVHYGCVPKTSPTTKKPLPAWFLTGGSEQLWETGRERIPDPPEGFQTDEEKSAQSGSPVLVAEVTTVETRIPITTPTGTTTESTTTTTTTRPTTPRTTRSSSSRSPARAMTEEMVSPHLYTDNSIPELSLEMVEIPLSEQAHHCPPTVSRSLAWNWTLAGETAIQPCPPGTTGLARWVCPLTSITSPLTWAGLQPDMSDCRSLSLTELESGVERGDLENVLSASLAHHTNTQPLYGGDVESAVAIIRTLANRIQYLLQTQGDKFYNKSQYIQEVLLNMVRAASNLLEPENREAWTDLHPSRQIKSASALVSALQENAFLFVSVTDTQEILVESSNNILMSASIMEIGRLTNGTSLPLSQYEEPYGQIVNTITIPFNVLWTEARAGITKILQFSFRNLEGILGQAEVDLSDEELTINSRIISAAFGPSRSQIQFPDSVMAELSHLERLGEGERSVCVWWDNRLSSWSQSGCHLASHNSSHSQCRCDSLAPLAVMRTRGPAHSSQSSTVPIMTLQIVTYIVAAISVVCVVLILVKFRRNIQKVLYKTPCLSQEEKHACNPRSRSCLNMGLSQDKNSTAGITLQNSMLHRPAVPACTLSPQLRRSPEVAGQDSGLAGLQPNLYRTTFENGQPVMVTLNPYSNQLVDNINKMMGDNLCYDTAMNPQLAKLTATLRKKQMMEPRMTENPGLQLTERAGGCMLQGGRMVDPSDVVFRAVSPHGHVYWEINPKQGHHHHHQQKQQQPVRSQASSSDENTNSDMQNISDLSDDDNRAASEMSRQSSSRFSESRPLIYSSSSSSTSPGHSATTEQLGYNTRPGNTKLVQRPRYLQDEVYAYAATDFSSGGQAGLVPEQVQSQVQIRDCRAVPVSVKSKEYIMAKIADYTERQSHQV